ncbi:family 16 glycoside hydrolase [Mycobacterium camsae]|uniref:family 16 glycoside hydrolase n=1 Tax=Mycobacterium gordonae TaxID=1778 RepID=UPI0019806301|nr:family 16 glycoside hydrolase [Mycobacterium gordonae]
MAVFSSGCGNDSHGSTGPQTLNFAGITWQVHDGKWQVEGDTLSGSGGHLATTQEFTDGFIDVDVDTPPAMGDRTVGIGFHITGPDLGNGYAFNFTATQTFNVFEGTGNNWQPVNPAMTSFQQTGSLQPDHNQFHIELAGDRYRVWANGQPLADFNDPSQRKGSLMLWVESSGWTVKFSHMRVR